MSSITVKAKKTFKYRIYLTKGQRRILEQQLEECRWLYNQTLATRKHAWEQEQRRVDWYETKRAIPLQKSVRPSLKVVHSQVLQNVTERVEMCSCCGKLVAKMLSDCTHSCTYCGLVMDRDRNAAINILRRGLQTLQPDVWTGAAVP